MPISPLISTDELASRLTDPSLVVVDCRHNLADPDAGERAWREGHIPGARFLHLDRDLSGPKTGRNGRHPLPDPALLAEKLGAAGIGQGIRVVACDDQSMFAPRLWWLLRWLGHDEVQVLDGGLKKWLAEGRPLTADVKPVDPVRFQPRPNREALVDVAFVERHLHDPNWRVIDARANSRYRGEGETLDPTGGHIPGARNRCFMDNLDATGTHRSPAELRAAFDVLLGGLPAERSIHQCGSGVTACANLLAMAVAGFEGAKLYPGSWSEWCANPSRPVATGD